MFSVFLCLVSFLPSSATQEKGKIEYLVEQYDGRVVIHLWDLPLQSSMDLLLLGTQLKSETKIPGLKIGQKLLDDLIDTDVSFVGKKDDAKLEKIIGVIRSWLGNLGFRLEKAPPAPHRLIVPLPLPPAREFYRAGFIFPLSAN
jgi:hypothetical protein